tara:strand:+ start:286 stop:498 length:213 start_codon:yes stop_codon:yes gene_type:complete
MATHHPNILTQANQIVKSIIQAIPLLIEAYTCVTDPTKNNGYTNLISGSTALTASVADAAIVKTKLTSSK